jgi:hypothetical protein
MIEFSCHYCQDKMEPTNPNSKNPNSLHLQLDHGTFSRGHGTLNKGHGTLNQQKDKARHPLHRSLHLQPGHGTFSRGHGTLNKGHGTLNQQKDKARHPLHRSLHLQPGHGTFSRGHGTLNKGHGTLNQHKAGVGQQQGNLYQQDCNKKALLKNNTAPNAGLRPQV